MDPGILHLVMGNQTLQACENMGCPKHASAQAACRKPYFCSPAKHVTLFAFKSRVRSFNLGFCPLMGQRPDPRRWCSSYICRSTGLRLTPAPVAELARRTARWPHLRAQSPDMGVSLSEGKLLGVGSKEKRKATKYWLATNHM